MDGYFYVTSMTELAQVPAIGETASHEPLPRPLELFFVRHIPLPQRGVITT
jgi:hypothetical protein